MIFEVFSYLATILLFAGFAVLIELFFSFKRMIKYSKLIGVLVVISVIGTLTAEPIALSWGIWSYAADKTFGIYIFGAALETIIFATFVAIAVGGATLVWSDFEKNKKQLIKTTIYKIRNKLKYLSANKNKGLSSSYKILEWSRI